MTPRGRGAPRSNTIREDASPVECSEASSHGCCEEPVGLRGREKWAGRGAGERPRPASEPAQSLVDSYCASTAIRAALMVEAQMRVPFSFRCRPSSMKMSSMTVPSACRNGVATSM